MDSKTKIYIVLEYFDRGELFDQIAKPGRLQEDLARRYFRQLINVVNYYHSRSMYHRDLKPENLLLDSNGALKVSDFGLSQQWCIRKSYLTICFNTFCASEEEA